jgi:hypothetical protein
MMILLTERCFDAWVNVDIKKHGRRTQCYSDLLLGRNMTHEHPFVLVG